MVCEFYVREPATRPRKLTENSIQVPSYLPFFHSESLGQGYKFAIFILLKQPCHFHSPCVSMVHRFVNDLVKYEVWSGHNRWRIRRAQSVHTIIY